MDIHTQLSDELIAWIKLAYIPKLRRRQFWQLLSRDSPQNLIAYSAPELQHLGLSGSQISYLKHQSARLIKSCEDWLIHDDHYILTSDSQDYPFLLSQISRAPHVLFIQGNPKLLTQPQVALVGSRHASHHGLLAADEFAQYLASDGFCITSGLALGVDGHAHQGALAVRGATLAVLGSGLARIYPAKHQQLAQRILDSQGALVSEFLPDTPPKAANFPRRNRIISGLSLGVLVIEAAQKSGSLITARYALEQNRDVFALPYSIYHVGGKGNNQLLNDGAMLALSPEYVAQELHQTAARLQACGLAQSARISPPIQQNNYPKQQSQQIELPITSKQELPFPELLANVGSEPVPIDILALRTHIPVHEVMLQILELELAGAVMAVPGGYIRK